MLGGQERCLDARRSAWRLGEVLVPRLGEVCSGIWVLSWGGLKNRFFFGGGSPSRRGACHGCCQSILSHVQVACMLSNLHMHCCQAKAPSSDVVKDAEAHVRNNSSCQELAVKRIAKIPVHHADDPLFKAFKEAGLTVPVPISYAKLEGCSKFPYIKFSHWVQVLGEADRLECLAGDGTWEEYKARWAEHWERMRVLHPDHEVFQLASSGILDLSQCIPCYSHKDEGTSKKKKQFMVLSTFGAHGYGTLQQRRKLANKVIKGNLKKDPMKMNFIGNTYIRRFMSFGMPWHVYTDKPHNLFTMIDLYAKDMRQLALQGTLIGRGRRVWVVCQGTTADWPAHVKCAGLNRSFGHGPKQPTSKTPCSGVCHLCLGGIEDFENPENSVPYEDLGRSPKWLKTMHQIKPWNSEPLELQIPHDQTRPADFFKPDLWHNDAQGVSRIWVATFCVEFNALEEGSKVDIRFERQSADFVEFWKKRGHTPYMKTIDKHKVGWPQTTSWPEGTWNRGAVTTDLMIWAANYGTRLLKKTGSTDELLHTLDTCS